MPVKEQGFSLLEVLIAMAISSVLLLGAARFLPALQRESLTSTRKLALEDEIWLRVFTVAKHLQRAGYCHGSCTGEGLEIVGQGDCIIVQWDANSNGIWDREPVKESDQYSAAIFLIPICISFDTAEKRRYATYLILNRRFSFEF